MPQPGYPKFLLMVVDPIARIRVDVFPDLEGRHSRISLVVLLSLTSVSAAPAEKKDFDVRWEQGEQNLRTRAGRRYFNDVFSKEFAGKYAVHMTECASARARRWRRTSRRRSRSARMDKCWPSWSGRT